MSMIKLSEHIIAVANKEKGRISNLQLQKVLYFVIGDYIAENGIDDFIRNIYDEPMQAWQYGPVLKSAYDKNKIYGSLKIRREGSLEENYSTFDIFITKRINQNIGNLIDESHEHEKWKNNKRSILNRDEEIVYSLEDFENEFTV